MTYYTASELRQRAGGLTASAAQSELSRLSKAAVGNFDVFLSHSFRDAVLILGLKRVLEADASASTSTGSRTLSWTGPR
jgi:hypothetical protein